MAFEFRLPDIGEGVAEGEIVKWHVKPGDSIQEDQVLVEIMTDKVTAEIPSPRTGTIQELKYKEGDVVNVGSVIVVYGEGQASASPKAAEAKAEAEHNGKTKTASSTAVATPAYEHHGKVLAAPATRKLARSLGVDITSLSGSGPHGRITPDDVKQSTSGVAVATPTPAKKTPAAAAPSSSTLSKSPSFTPRDFGPVQERERRMPFSGLRRKIAEHLVKSKHTAPHFAYVDEVDVTELVAARKQLQPLAEAQGVKMTYLPFIIKATIAAIRQFPVVNSTLDDAKQELIYKDHVHMGIAVATDDGLIVPVVKHADQKSLIELAHEIVALSEKARTGKLQLSDLQGGTFTITSIGSIGGLFGVPIINYPEVAILGVNKIEKRPVVRDNEIVIREMMHLSLSADHRVVDGAEAAQFVNEIIANLEAPLRLLAV